MISLATVSAMNTAMLNSPSMNAPALDGWMLGEFLMAFVTMVVWLHVGNSRSCLLWLAICIAGLAPFAFVAGAWPLGLLVCGWSGTTFRRWLANERGSAASLAARIAMVIPDDRWESQSRFAKHFTLN
jgi:hypothetical protein